MGKSRDVKEKPRLPARRGCIPVLSSSRCEESSPSIRSIACSAQPATLALGVSGAVDQLCEKFHLIKPYIEPALVFVKLLPKGKQIAQVVEFLTDIANKLCPAPGAAPQTTARAFRSPKPTSIVEAPAFGDVGAAFGKLSAALSAPGTRQVAAPQKWTPAGSTGTTGNGSRRSSPSWNGCHPVVRSRR